MFENCFKKNYPDDVPNEIPFVYFIYSILRGCAVACFTSEESCFAAFEQFDPSFYAWVAVDYKKLFWYFAEREPDHLMLVNDDEDFSYLGCPGEEFDVYKTLYPSEGV